MPHPLLPDLETLVTDVAASKGFALCGIQLLTHMSPMTLEVQIRHSSGADVSLEFVAGAGHSDSEPGLVDALVRATNGLRSYLQQ